MPHIEVIVWIDANASVATQARLRALGPELAVFSDLESCIDHISSPDKSFADVLLIVSGSFGQNLAHVLNGLPQVYAAYVYCFNISKHVAWAEKYSKIGIYRVLNREDDLLTRIAGDLKDAQDQTCELPAATFLSRIVPNEQETNTGINIFTADELNKTTRDLTEEKVAFVWFQVLSEILITMPQLPTAKEELLEAWSQACGTSRNETNLIDQFRRDYTPEQAFYWYTRNTFLYKSLNQALRSENIDNIYKFRLFIADLHEQLTSEFQSSDPAEPDLTVYRGQRMTIAEAEKLCHNLHGLIFMNSFVSTTVDKAVTRSFLTAKSKDQRKTTVSVLWKMLLNKDIARETQKPFADIKNFSAFNKEAEILLSMGTIFRIDKIERSSPDSYCFELTMCRASIDPQHQALYDYTQKQIASVEGMNYSTYGKFLAFMSCFDSSIAYYHQVLSKVPKPLKLNDVALATIHNDLAYAYRESHRYQEAVRHYQTALDLRLMQGPSGEKDLAITYSDFGWLLMNMRHMEKALNFHQRALKIRERSLGYNHSDTAMSYNCLGLVATYTGNFDLALQYLTNALTIRRECLPAQHPFIAMTFSSFGSYYEALSDYSETENVSGEALKNRSLALEMHKQALSIYKNSVPPTHGILGSSYRSVGLLYLRHREWQAAIQHLTACVFIRRRSGSDRLPDSLYNLGQAYAGQGEYQRAIDFYEEALTLAEKAGENRLAEQIQRNIQRCKNRSD
ncbi:unnamed protein product [Adineta ricciae]|uniref:ADP ribosyltransferase domain-containing protein n=1 Tax=Adineta ricciae TaxID=249248 RepID=A0A815XVM5_ADIRI|nr:unnamed protein product [Adineta ricciae]